MFPKILLVLALLVANAIGAAGQGGEVVGAPLEGALGSPYYQLLVAQDPADPRVFHIWAPNEVITPVRVEAVVGTDLPWLSGRHFKIEKLEGFIGPFEWHPAFPDGWGVSITFDEVPSVVVIVVVASTFSVGFGYWGPRPLGHEIFLPTVSADG